MTERPTTQHTASKGQDEEQNAPDDATSSIPAIRHTCAVKPLWALGIFIVIATLFMSPLVDGQSFSVIEARMHTVYPWADSANAAQEIPAQFDSADLSVPWQRVYADARTRGTLGYWSPNVYGGGAPLFSNGTSGQLYPPRLVLTALTSDRWFHDAWVFFHLVAGAMCAYGLVRSLQRSWAASIFVGAAWMLSSFNLGWAHLEVVTPLLIAIPLSLWSVHRLHVQRDARQFVLASMSMALILVSGHMLWMALTLQMAALYACCLAVPEVWASVRASKWRAASTSMFRAGGPFILGAGLSAVVCVPSLMNLSKTPRSPFERSALESFIGPIDLVTSRLVFKPNVDPMTTDVLNGELTFIGIAVTLCAIVGFFSRKRGAWLGRSIFSVLALIMVWLPAATVAYFVIVGMDVMYPYTRGAGWLLIGVCVLAAFGFDTVVGTADTALMKLSHVSAVTGFRKRLRPIMLLFALVAVVVQLIPFGRAINPDFQSRDDDSWFPDTPLIREMRNVSEHHGWQPRFAQITTPYVNLTPGGPAILWANHGSFLGLDTLSGYDSTLPLAASQRLRVIAGEEASYVEDHPLTGAYAPSFEIDRTKFELMALAKVDALVLSPLLDPYDERLSGFGPYDVVYSGDDGSLLVSDTPSGGPRVVTTENAKTDPTSSLVVTTLREGSSMTLNVEADSAGVLVVPTNYDSGWSATIDGNQAHIGESDGGFLAVDIDEGSHTVAFEYRPPGLRVGFILSVASFVLLLGVLMFSFFQSARGNQRQVEPT